MKPKQGAYIICAIFAVLLTLLMLILPASSNLFVAYAFALLSIGLMAGGVAAFKGSDIAGSIALLRQTGRHLPWTLLFSFIVLLPQWIGLFALPFVLHIFVQVIVALLFSIKLIKLYTAKSYVEQMDEKVAVNRNIIADWTNKVAVVMLRGDLSIEAKQALKKVQDAIRYSDPMSNANVTTYNSRISDLLVTLSDSAEGDIPSVCNQIIEQVSMRNSVLKATK